jgi:hypothetical protein
MLLAVGWGGADARDLRAGRKALAPQSLSIQNLAHFSGFMENGHE